MRNFEKQTIKKKKKKKKNKQNMVWGYGEKVSFHQLWH